MNPFPDTLAGNIAAILALVSLGVILTAFVLKGGLRFQRQRAERANRSKRARTDDQVDGLLHQLGVKGGDLQVIRHSSDGVSTDLTDEELESSVDGVLQQRRPISQHSVLYPVDVVDPDKN